MSVCLKVDQAQIRTTAVLEALRLKATDPSGQRVDATGSPVGSPVGPGLERSPKPIPGASTGVDPGEAQAPQGWGKC